MKLDIVRAWKDETYRQSLSDEQFSTLPANPAGEMELSDTCLDTIYGGTGVSLKKLVVVLSNISLFSVNVLANPFNQTCFQNR